MEDLSGISFAAGFDRIHFFAGKGATFAIDGRNTCFAEVLLSEDVGRDLRPVRWDLDLV